jgi:hypothetical protein
MQGTIYINNPENDLEQENGQSSDTPETLLTEVVTPEVITKSGKFSPYIENFLKKFEEEHVAAKSSSLGKIKVSEVLGGLARLYERVRTVVEYKGDHVIRRNAIERMLKRLVWEQGNIRDSIDEKRVAESLIRELIWARYLPNDSVEKDKVEEVRVVIEKYIYFLRNLDSITGNISASDVRSFIWGVASSEIEDLLDPSNRELYVNLMFDWYTDRFNWIDTEISEHDKSIQIYLAIHRAHAKSDEPIMRYNLLLKEIPDWKEMNREKLNKFIVNFPKIYDEIEGHLNYKGGLTLYRRIQRYSAAFDIFREVASQEKLNLRKLLGDEKAFENKIREICEVKYAQIRKKVNTGIVRSIVYIFITKITFAMLIEIPYEIYMYNEVRYLPLSINIMFPPFMMWVIGMSTRVPGAKNTESIIERLQTVVYPTKRSAAMNFSVMASSRKSSLSTVFSLIYLSMFLLVFGGIATILNQIGFSLSGLIIFFFFLSLVMLFAFKVRFHAVSLNVNAEEDNFVSHLISYLTLPFLNFGFYLSRGLAKINFFSIILDFIIEAPLKSIIEIFEEWTSFIREKKEEVIERPE